MLGVRVGDTLEADVLEGARQRFTLPVTGFIDDFVGLSAYLDLAELERDLGEPRAVSGALLAIYRSRVQRVIRRLERITGGGQSSGPDLDKAEHSQEPTRSRR